MRTHLFLSLFAISLFWLTSGTELMAQTDPTHIGGTQYRGSPGHNAELVGSAIRLRRSMIIYKVECLQCEGFWLDRDGEQYRTYSNAQNAVGDTLPPGEYHAFPNLDDDRSRSSASVTVYIR